MRIKNQFRISIIIFIVILAIIAGSIFVTQQQAVQLNNQQTLSIDIQTRAGNLAYISNDYFLYQQGSGLEQWQTEFSSLTSDLSKLIFSSPEQQTLLNNTKNDAQRLNSRWTDVVSYLENAPRNVSIRVLPEFQTKSSRMSLQNQAVIFDGQQLSQTLRSQIDQLNTTRVILVLTLLGLFGAYFITNYLVTYRNTLNSISELQAGIAVVGSGKLDYSLKADRKDEVGEISRSVNQMAANLKNVTASKTELEQAQASLRESEQRWATTLASIGDAVIATDTAGKIVFMNGEAEELTGWTQTEASQQPVKTVFNIVNEQTHLEVESPIERVLIEGVVVGLANHTVLIRKNGFEVPIDDSGAPIKDKNGNITGVVLVFNDITERKELDRKLENYSANLENLVEVRTKQLRDAERLASIGATAGMVGHDIRNPLQAITGDVYLAKTELASTTDSEEKKNALESLDAIEENIFYINKIVADLQDYARPIKPVTKEIDLPKLIFELITRNGIPENVKVQVKVQKEADALISDSDILKRILGNLVTNAVQAMPKGGKLSIQAFKEANDSIITVSDTGVGIPEDVKDKLFTPLFTTKSKGQGFGLAVVKRLTEVLGGTVTFETEDGKGTKFILHFRPPTKN
jgi:PAS domain S-box-containing protein